MTLPTLRAARPADLARDPVVPLVLRLAGPAILGISAHALQMLANGWFVADLGTVAIATIGIAHPVTLLVAALGYGAGIAAASVLSRALGRGDRALADAAASLGFWLALPPGSALTGLILLHPPFWLGLLRGRRDPRRGRRPLHGAGHARHLPDARDRRRRLRGARAGPRAPERGRAGRQLRAQHRARLAADPRARPRHRGGRLGRRAGAGRGGPRLSPALPPGAGAGADPLPPALAALRAAR